MWFKDDKLVFPGPDTNIYENTLSLSIKPGNTETYMYVCQARLEGRSVKSAKSESHSLIIYGKFCFISLTMD